MEPNTLALLFLAASNTYSIPANLLSAVCFVETGHKTNVIHHHDGSGDSLGVCQVKLATARLMGFKGSYNELMKPEINIDYSAKYLSYQLQRYNWDFGKAIAAYNSGSHRVNDRGVTKNRAYVSSVIRAWEDGK